MKSYIDMVKQEVVYYRESVVDNYKIRYEIKSGWFYVTASGDFVDNFTTLEQAVNFLDGV
ncbi:hypothetical protein NVP1187O_095 [Vibrio phage 1.187.O._10N.286.49.F1]|nr:hypothetical protein NVP1187O_095 [Vibrio phage 1.187.O._10N.286.49.F1]